MNTDTTLTSEEIIAEVERRYGPSPKFDQPSSITSWSQGAIARELARRLQSALADLKESDAALLSVYLKALPTTTVTFHEEHAAILAARQRAGGE